MPKFLQVKVHVSVMSFSLTCVSTTNLYQDAHMAKNADSDTLRLMGQPSKKSKKSGVKGSVALSKESTQLGCVSQESYPRKSIPREPGMLGSKHTVKLSRGTWHQIKNREREGSSRGSIRKCEPHERSLCAPKIEERSHEETFAPRKMRPQRSMEFGESV